MQDDLLDFSAASNLYNFPVFHDAEEEGEETVKTNNNKKNTRHEHKRNQNHFSVMGMIS